MTCGITAVKRKKIVDDVFELWQGLQMRHAYREFSAPKPVRAVRVMGGFPFCVLTHFCSREGGLTVRTWPVVIPHTNRRTE
jgi:hypothetical protein